MRPFLPSRRFRRLLAPPLATALLALSPAVAGAHPVAPCAHADTPVPAQTAETAAHATQCLINHVRRAHGLHALRTAPALHQAAAEHAADMVDHQYFAHDSLDGRTLTDRDRAVGYVPNAGRWEIGENLAWGTGARSTPDSIVDAWMHSPEHRRNILTAAFRETGVAVAPGVPESGMLPGATFVQEFGMRDGG